MKTSKRRPRGSSAVEADTLAVSEFKTRCLEILEDLRQSGHELVVTKHGTPIARVVPIRSELKPLRGMLKGQIEIVGDIVHADFSDEWEASR